MLCKKVKYAPFLLVFVLLFLVAVSELFAEEKSASPTAERPASTSPATASKTPGPSSTPKPPVVSRRPEKRIEPLGVWVRREPEKKKTKKEHKEQEALIEKILQSEELEIEEERALFQELLKRYKREHVFTFRTAPLVKRTILNKKQRRRLEKMEKLQRRRLREQKRWLSQFQGSEGRGRAELRVCTLDLDGYGLKKAVKRLLRGKAAKLLKRKEKRIVSAIGGSGCTVVAVQNVIGQKRAQAKAALEGLAEKLSENTPLEWKAYLGSSNNKLVFNGFLVSDDGIRVESVSSYRHIELLGFGDFDEKDFSRGPFQIDLSVENRSVEQTRRVILITFSFRESLKRSSKGSETYRMQMAEMLRRLVQNKQRGFDTEDPPILVVLGDRVGTRYAPATQVLEGSIRLRDFLRSGSCILKEVEKKEPEKKPKKKKSKKKNKRKRKPKKPEMMTVAECNPRPGHIKQLFGLFAENTIPLRFRVSVEEGEKRYVRLVPTKKTKARLLRERNGRTSEIYLVHQDLRYARLGRGGSGRFAVAHSELKGFPEESPLIGVDLNW